MLCNWTASKTPLHRIEFYSILQYKIQCYWIKLDGIQWYQREFGNSFVSMIYAIEFYSIVKNEILSDWIIFKWMELNEFYWIEWNIWCYWMKSEFIE